MSITCDFFNQSTIEKNGDNQAIMDFLSSADSVNRMIVASDLGLPAITPVVAELEDRFGNCNDSPLNHDGVNQNAVNRQNVGRMVKFIMRQFGYAPIDGGLSERARIPKCARTQYFSTAAVYGKLQNDKHSKYKIKVDLVKI